MQPLAIVILNYNGRDFLEKFLPSVVEYSPQNSVIVADNCSTDDSVAFLTEHHPTLRLIQNTTNGGFSQGYNEALAQIEAKYYVLLNSDVEVTPDWTTSIIDMMESDQSIAAAQPKILSYHDKTSFEYAGAAGGYLDHYGYPFCKGRIFQALEQDHGQYNKQYPVFWATGACLFIKSEIYHQLGGLDNDFFAHMEEIDLCWRIQNAGYQIMYNGESSVYHVGGGTLSASNPKKTYLNFRNGLSLLVKNYNAFDLVLKFPVRLVLDYIACFKFLISGAPKDALAVVKAHFHFWVILPKNLKKRKVQEFKRQRISNNGEVLIKSIVWQYYILGKKKYNNL